MKNMCKLVKYFKNKYKTKDPIENQPCEIIDPLHKHNQLLIEKVIELLETKPQLFSAMWFGGDKIEDSIMSQDNKIHIMIGTGEIIKPIHVEMNTNQKKIIKKLIALIVERDSKILIDGLLVNYK